MESQKEKKEKSFSEKTNDMKSLFSKNRDKWTNLVFDLTKMLRNYDKLTDLQISIHNEIMNGMNDKATLVNHLISLNKILREKKYDKLVEIKTELDLKVKTRDEQNFVIENEIKDILEREELLSMQIDYMENVIKNLKDLLWGIKNYIEVKKIIE